MLGLNTQTLVDWRGRGVGPAFIQLYGKAMYRKSEIERWLDERTTHTSDSAPWPVNRRS